MSEGFMITNPDRNRLAAVAAKHGLKAIKIGMRLNTGYTPTRCRQVAEQFTGRTFKARDYDGMIAAIDNKLSSTADVHDDVCATHRAHPCNCAMAVFKEKANA